ncbi:hypothetical protein COCVIDRAFT_18888 [Bipolaris victoriae FI3]|uniref:Uncharacterized protein n=1 Tax=Bipolaris victoriae (strain FI3) TaxID=930091 RepID=W7ECL7_BIPV3|nr:hypothetical protein COCVIDRAFT_18888 [Bipolaris victoriae FI3]
MSNAAIITCSVFVTAVRAPQAIRLVVQSPASPAICLAFVAYILPIVPCIASIILATQGLTAYGLQVHVFTLYSLAWIDWMYIDKWFAGMTQHEWSELPRPKLSQQWLCRIGVVIGYIVSGCVVLYLHNSYANLATLLVFSGSYVYLSIQPWPQAFQREGMAWLCHYQIAFTVVLVMASITLSVVLIIASTVSTVGAILLQKIAVSFPTWLPIIRRTKPTQNHFGVGNSPYGWRNVGGSEESMWHRRVETLEQLLAVLGTESDDKKIGNGVMMRMANTDKALFLLCIQCSERLDFSSTKEFLSACTDGTLDESRLAEPLRHLGSSHIKTAEFAALLSGQREALRWQD